jgi:acyl carrier protein
VDDLQVRLVACFAGVFPSLTEREICDADASTVKGWDSVASVTLFATVEEEFGVEIDIAEMAELLSFRSMFAYLRAKKAAPGQV